MIIKAPEGGTRHVFESRMLAENTIRGLLSFQENLAGDGSEYYYEITSRQPLSRIMESRKLSAQDIRQIVTGILEAVNGLDEFLLSEDQLLLDPEYIYMDPDSMDVRLCLVPGYARSTPEAMTALLRIILEHTDHQDAEGIMIAYNLYEKSLRDNYGIRDLMACLGGNDRIFEPSEEEEEDEPEPEIPAPEVMPKNPEDEELVGKAFLKAGKYGNGLEKGKILRTAVVLILVAEGFLWYLGGIGAFRKVGPFIPAAAAAAAGAALLVKQASARSIRKDETAGGERASTIISEKQPQVPEEKSWMPERNVSAPETSSRNLRERPEERAPETPVWAFRPESTEEYRERKEKEKEERMDRSFAEGTVLLSSGPSGGQPVAVLEPLGGGENICITYSPFIIGQHKELTDYCLNRPTVSRLHARFSVENGEGSVTDLNSRNGTSVNGRKLEANETVLIADGDLIYLADAGFRFHLLAQETDKIKT